jgi:Flp pilus assembly protein TadG
MATLMPARKRGERGQAIIEMALTLPLLLVIVMGIFDFGFMFQKYEVVTNAAREGARVGVLGDFTPANAATSPLGRQRALDYLAVGGIDLAGHMRGSVASCAGAVVADSVCVSAVVADTTITGSSPAKIVRQLTVTVEHDHQFDFVGPILNLFGGTLGTTRLRAVSTMRMEAN